MMQPVAPSSADTAGEQPLAGLRVVLLIEQARNRALVSELLGGSAEIADGSGGADQRVDLFIADARGLQRQVELLQSCRRGAHPAVVPCLLLQSPRGPGPSDAIWSLVDDVVQTPVGRRELALRIQALARTRRLSVEVAAGTAELGRRHEELNRLYSRLQSAHEALEMVSSQKSQLLGMAAHDLRNPLSVVHQYVRLLRDAGDGIPDGERREVLEVTASTTAFLLEMIDDLLDVAQIEAGRLDLERRPQDLRRVVGAAVGLYRIIAARKSIEILCDVPAEAALAAVDEPKIRQVIDNLLGNAVKYSNDGTRIQVRLSAAGEGLGIWVQDQGPGIAAHDMERLFEPFQRGAGGAGRQRGTGLGLTIAKRIVEGHGGHLEATSAPGAGSTFRLWLPCSGPPPGDPSPGARGVEPQPGNPQLLEEDRKRLQLWRRRSAADYAAAVEPFLQVAPALLLEIQEAAGSGEAKRLQRAAYRAGWQVKRFSMAAHDAALTLETAARERDPERTATALLAFEGEMTRLRGVLSSSWCEVGSAPRSRAPGT